MTQETLKSANGSYIHNGIVCPNVSLDDWPSDDFIRHEFVGALSEALETVLEHIRMFPNKALAIDCYLLCLGRIEGNQSTLAKSHGVTKACVNKTVGQIRDTYGCVLHGNRPEIARTHSAAARTKPRTKGNTIWEHSKLFLRRQ